jgi:hypothetical protein
MRCVACVDELCRLCRFIACMLPIGLFGQIRFGGSWLEWWTRLSYLGLAVSGSALRARFVTGVLAACLNGVLAACLNESACDDCGHGMAGHHSDCRVA